jgi:hypothetical protein
MLIPDGEYFRVINDFIEDFSSSISGTLYRRHKPS